MSGALDTALTELGPRVIVLDEAPPATLSAVIAWVAARSDVLVTWESAQPGLLVTADDIRAEQHLARGRPVLVTGAVPGPLIAPDGWMALELPDGVLFAPEPAPEPEPHATPAPQIAIIVPIHDAGAELRRCVEALSRNTTLPAELVLVDDASTDPEVLAVLHELDGWPAVRVLRNTTNLGFTASVNRGLRATAADVVVLNSDTEVGPRWLERLRAAAYASPQTGSATATSDNAGAFSLPVIGEPNPLPLQLDADGAARAVAQATAGERAPTPTANGFCMYLRRAMLDDVGPFDEAAFPRGYGEENDLCLRASRRGWAHVVDTGTYVHHVREASFGAEKPALGKAGRAVLDARFPEYTAAVRAFVADPVMTRVRERAAAALAAPAVPLARVLFVIHEGGGGTPVGNFELMNALAGRIDCLLLTCDRVTVRLDRMAAGERIPIESWELDAPTRVLDFSREDYRAIVERVLASTRSSSSTSATCSSTRSTCRSSPRGWASRSCSASTTSTSPAPPFTCSTTRTATAPGAARRATGMPRPAGRARRAAASQARLRAPVARGGQRDAHRRRRVRDDERPRARGAPRRAAGDRASARSRSSRTGAALDAAHGLAAHRGPARRCGSSCSPTSSATRAASTCARSSATPASASSCTSSATCPSATPTSASCTGAIGPRSSPTASPRSPPRSSACSRSSPRRSRTR